MDEQGTYGSRPVPYPEGNLTAQELFVKLRTSYNTEARAGHGAEHLAMHRVGFVDYGKRVMVVYEDEEGNAWHDTLYREPDGRIVSETEHIFGAGWRDKFRRGAKK